MPHRARGSSSYNAEIGHRVMIGPGAVPPLRSWLRACMYMESMCLEQHSTDVLTSTPAPSFLGAKFLFDYRPEFSSSNHSLRCMLIGLAMLLAHVPQTQCQKIVARPGKNR